MPEQYSVEPEPDGRPKNLKSQTTKPYANGSSKNGKPAPTIKMSIVRIIAVLIVLVALWCVAYLPDWSPVGASTTTTKSETRPIDTQIKSAVTRIKLVSERFERIPGAKPVKFKLPIMSDGSLPTFKKGDDKFYLATEVAFAKTLSPGFHHILAGAEEVRPTERTDGGAFIAFAIQFLDTTTSSPVWRITHQEE